MRHFLLFFILFYVAFGRIRERSEVNDVLREFAHAEFESASKKSEIMGKLLSVLDDQQEPPTELVETPFKIPIPAEQQDVDPPFPSDLPVPSDPQFPADVPLPSDPQFPSDLQIPSDPSASSNPSDDYENELNNDVRRMELRFPENQKPDVVEKPSEMSIPNGKPEVDRLPSDDNEPDDDKNEETREPATQSSIRHPEILPEASTAKKVKHRPKSVKILTLPVEYVPQLHLFRVNLEPAHELAGIKRVDWVTVPSSKAQLMNVMAVRFLMMNLWRNKSFAQALREHKLDIFEVEAEACIDDDCEKKLPKTFSLEFTVELIGNAVDGPLTTKPQALETTKKLVFKLVTPTPATGKPVKKSDFKLVVKNAMLRVHFDVGKARFQVSLTNLTTGIDRIFCANADPHLKAIPQIKELLDSISADDTMASKANARKNYHLVTVKPCSGASCGSVPTNFVITCKSMVDPQKAAKPKKSQVRYAHSSFNFMHVSMVNKTARVPVTFVSRHGLFLVDLNPLSKVDGFNRSAVEKFDRIASMESSERLSKMLSQLSVEYASNREIKVYNIETEMCNNATSTESTVKNDCETLPHKFEIEAITSADKN